MKLNKTLLPIFLFILSMASFAQEGTVAGIVNDGEFSEPMAFANILVKGTTTGTTSDFDGKYSLNLDPGNYTLVFSFVGYQTVEISDVIIKNNDVTNVDVTLNTNSLETVVITTTLRKNTEAAILDLQKNSVSLLDGLSAQSIKKTGAGDIAAAVKSVPGVSVQGGKYVYVRGLGDRYTKSILNGVDIPGLDPDRNTIQMDIFPTNILENVVVVKSAAAEYPADFTGGVVDIVTKDFPTRKERSVSVGAAINPSMHFRDDFLNYNGSGTDFLGFDNGDRDYPINRYQPIPNTFDNNEALSTLTQAFDDQLSAQLGRNGSNLDFGFTAGDQFEVGDNRLGYQLSFSYKNKSTFYKDRIDGTYTKDEQNSSNNELLGTRLTVGDEGINDVLLNGLLGIVYKRDRAKYKLTFLHIQNGESSAGYFDQQIAQAGGGSGFEQVFKDALLYTQRSVSNALLTGKHTSDSWTTEWKLSPTLSRVDDKDHRITPLRLTQEGEYVISPSAATFPVRIWRELFEVNFAGKVDVAKKYELWERASKLKFGGAYTYKFRDFEIDDNFFTISRQNGNISVEDGIADNLLTDANIWTPDNDSGTHLISDEYERANSYEGEQRVTAAYASNEFRPFEKLRAIIGLRAEKFESYYTGQNQSAEVLLNNAKVLDKFDLFPSANLVYNLTDNTNIRTSYSRTTARPSFKEASLSQIFDPVTNRLFIGNLNVQPSYINNFDIRYEYFGEEGEMFAVSGFYKDFTDPIELTFFEAAPDQLTPNNLGSAKVYGAELEFRKNLGFISESFSNLKFNLNASLITSKLTMFDDEFNRRVLAARDGESIDRERDLQGQSPFLINAGLDYSNDDIGLQTGLFFNVQGETLEVVGTGIVPDVYTSPFNSLNYTLNKTLGAEKRSSINLKVSNILGDDRESVYQSFNAQDQLFSRRSPGTEFSLGFSHKF